MENKILLICMIIACICRLALAYIQKDIWKMPMYKYYILIPIMQVVGTLGAQLSSLIAYGSFSGTRLYGTVLALAIALPIMAKILRVDVDTLGGFSSCGTWLSIAIMKIPCIINGCCYGFMMSNWKRFPSQIVELVIAVLFFVWFFILAKKGFNPKFMFPLMMVWYGIYRYVVDFFRGDPRELESFVLWIPAGRVFSIIILAVGLVWLLKNISDYNKNKKPDNRIKFINVLFGRI